MPIDISLQFNGHNSYRAIETARSQPFGVQGKQWITHSLHAMANSSLTAAVRAETRFYRANGLLLSKVSHTFPVSVLWDKVVIAVAVPALAVQAQIALLPGPTTWWWVEAKSEEGQTATPYNINYAGQLTKLTPTGMYTGLLSVEQIVVRGSQLNPEEDLGERLLTISNSHVTLSDFVSKRTTRITSGGLYTGEVVADQITAGILKSANRYSWIDLNNGTLDFGRGKLTFDGTSTMKVGGWTVAAEGLSMTSGEQVGPFTVADQDKILDHVLKVKYLSSSDLLKYDLNIDGQVTSTDNVFMGMMIDGRRPAFYTRLYGVNFRPRHGLNPFLESTMTNDAGTVLRGTSLYHHKIETAIVETSAIQFGDFRAQWFNGSENFDISNGTNKLSLRNTASAGVSLRSGAHEFGIDSQGPYFIKNETKKYLT